MDPNQFESLMRRIREGDEDAARECVEHFEPELRRIARVRLRDPRLRSLADSIDVSQSVFGKFFQRYSSEQKIETKEQLLALLVKMTKNRVIDLARKHRPPQKAVDGGMVAAREVTQLGDLDAMIEDSGPSTVIASKDLAEHIRQKLSAEEFDLVSRRNQGQAWEQISDALGQSAESLRKRLARALQRVRDEMNLEAT
ncbi:MAG: sigma-70 family RNA polymerase sigma factor [Planctomycetota bacterium]